MAPRRIKIGIILIGLWLSNFSVQGQQQTPINYEKFTHKSHGGMVKVPGTNQTRELKCESCHDPREAVTGLVATTDRNRQLRLKFPSHKACVECHIAQFTGKPLQTCTICHQQDQAPKPRPPQRDFPPRYDFNAFFDAKQHELHVTYDLPGMGRKTDCTFCHQPDTKPAALRIASHPECFVCHAPNSQDAKAKLKADCQVCHTATVDQAQPFSAKLVSRAYGAMFTHQSHVKYVDGKCDACHTISGGYNQPAPASLKVKQHLSPAERGGRGCFSCHDGGVHYGRKVFSGEPGSEGGGSCNKCHTRQDFKVTASRGG